MIDALRYESVRVRTVASTYWTVLLGLLLCGLIALGSGSTRAGQPCPLRQQRFSSLPAGRACPSR